MSPTPHSERSSVFNLDPGTAKSYFYPANHVDKLTLEILTANHLSGENPAEKHRGIKLSTGYFSNVRKNLLFLPHHYSWTLSICWALVRNDPSCYVTSSLVDASCVHNDPWSHLCPTPTLTSLCSLCQCPSLGAWSGSFSFILVSPSLTFFQLIIPGEKLLIPISDHTSIWDSRPNRCYDMALDHRYALWAWTSKTRTRELGDHCGTIHV